MFSILGTIVVGFIVGLLARALKPGNDKLGLIMTTVLGIAGSLLARSQPRRSTTSTGAVPAGVYGLVKKKA